MEAFNITIPNLDALVNAFRQAPEIGQQELTKAFFNSKVALSDATNQRTVPYRTTNLIRTFAFDIEPMKLTWFPTAVYAKAVEFGMPPSQGRYVPAIGKRLKHNIHGDAWFGTWPGFAGRHYMENIVDEATPTITQIFADALTNITNKIAQQ